jgi:hypothetical protein
MPFIGSLLFFNLRPKICFSSSFIIWSMCSRKGTVNQNSRNSWKMTRKFSTASQYSSALPRNYLLLFIVLFTDHYSRQNFTLWFLHLVNNCVESINKAQKS